MPVSYTHLDVYKRQVKVFSVVEHAQPGGPGVLYQSSLLLGQPLSPQLKTLALHRSVLLLPFEEPTPTQKGLVIFNYWNIR